MAGPGGKRLPLGNQQFKQSTRGEQTHCCLNSVRCTSGEAVSPAWHRYLIRCGVLHVLMGRLCAENVHVSLLVRFNNLLLIQWKRLEKVIFYPRLGKFHRKYVSIDATHFQKLLTQGLLGCQV